MSAVALWLAAGGPEQAATVRAYRATSTGLQNAQGDLAASSEATPSIGRSMSIVVAGAGTRSTYLEIPTTWVFPVTSGAHSYSLDAGQVAFSGGPFAFENPVLVAQYVPFGATGSQTSLRRASAGAR